MTPESGNQYAAYSATGGGINGTGSTYAVAYGASSATVLRRRSLCPAHRGFGANITNTTYAYLSMLNGISSPRSSPHADWFPLTISGFDANGKPARNGRFQSGDRDKFVTDWTPVDLTSLGNNVKSLQFDLTST